MRNLVVVIFGLLLVILSNSAYANDRKQKAKEMAKKYVRVSNGKASVDVGKIISRTAAAAVLESTRRKAKTGGTIPDNAFQNKSTEGCPDGTSFEGGKVIKRIGNNYVWVQPEGCGN